MPAYYDSRLAASPSHLAKATTASTIPMNVHAKSISGSVPLSEKHRRSFATMLQQVASSESDPVIRRAAGDLRQFVALSDPSITQLGAGAITLKLGCGPRVNIKSTADVAVQIRIRVSGSEYEIFSLRRGDGKSPTMLPLALPRGVVTAFSGGREVAKLARKLMSPGAYAEAASTLRT